MSISVYRCASVIADCSIYSLVGIIYEYALHTYIRGAVIIVISIAVIIVVIIDVEWVPSRIAIISI